MTPAPSLLRLEDVCARVGLSRSQVYHLAALGELPRPRKVGGRSSRWVSTEIDAYVESVRDSQPEAA